MDEQLKIRQWVPTAKKYPHEFLTMLQKVQDFGYTGAEPDALLHDFFLAMTVPSRNSYSVLDFRLVEDGVGQKIFGLLGGIVGQDTMTKERIAVFMYPHGRPPELFQEGVMSTIMEENYVWPAEEKPAEPDPSEEPKKFYYATFDKNTDILLDGRGATSKIPYPVVIDVHPIQYRNEFNKQYGSYKQTPGGMRMRETLYLNHWQELTVAEYHLFKDTF